MWAGRLLRDHQQDRADGVGTVGRNRADVIREMIEQIEQGPDDDPSRDLLPKLRAQLDAE